MVGVLSLRDAAVGGLFVFTVAVLYIAMGALLRDNVQLVTGIWIGVVNVVALSLGPHVYSLLLAVLGGGALLVAGWLTARRPLPDVAHVD